MYTPLEYGLCEIFVENKYLASVCAKCFAVELKKKPKKMFSKKKCSKFAYVFGQLNEILCKVGFHRNKDVSQNLMQTNVTQ